MVEALARRKAPATFNGAFEAGVRAVALLAAAHPYSFDLQRLIAFDYLLVHTGDVGGPASLHPPAPLHSAELLVRRKVVEQALLLMMTRDLVQREVSAAGIRYRAGENATPFLQAPQSDYLGALKDRAEWLVGEFGALSDAESRALMRRFFDRWVEEFQVAERSLGAES